MGKGGFEDPGAFKGSAQSHTTDLLEDGTSSSL